MLLYIYGFFIRRIKMDETMIIQFAADVAIGDIDAIARDMYNRYGWAIADIYPAKVVR